MNSMTGFGRASLTTDEFSLTVELRTVNNRFLDIQVRLPSELAAAEVPLRKLIQARLQRGRVEATVSLVQQRPVTFQVNLPLVQGYVAALRQAQAATGVAGDFDLSLIARLPGAIQPVTETDAAFTARLAEGLLTAAGQALDALTAMRQTEGAALAQEIAARLEQIAARIPEIEAAAALVFENQRARLERRMQALLRDLGSLDETRLAQEAAYAAERCDITEEVARLRSHVAQMRDLLTSDAAGVGKAMDFLLQEMNREVNTMLSKTSDTTVHDVALFIKTEVEKIKEQAQNVE
ncbi:YicC/YloC family endoribonuclease [Chloracidobacterium aggregatum]|uniref:YicC family protein n=1 Tax=Chloracidobacterium sp. N TaxID=2821540 RepID=A0ABX8B4F4_9BACT|nr:YicC/YloC family endoribonuclease [Chloracidobacterium aggregatum]QUV85318.1 YicC family protein [Chloracidobacterium sp. 2]QUV88282.1 YicC family protein [Chloracidobacterium sp. S]QUV91201.1 YicC family protein [Chloracidobacterium sp. A]QUV94386.1 YicC family protein [Chloracidobacterium sp. N]QUV97585.1 YicC family protein [Chloracidobacterium sp. E]